ncbi:MAG: hypothetical protein AAFR30_11275, partial [Cyanobacteria bacterium J06628_4]
DNLALYPIIQSTVIPETASASDRALCAVTPGKNAMGNAPSMGSQIRTLNMVFGRVNRVIGSEGERVPQLLMARK